MKILVLSICLLGVCLAQQHRRPQQFQAPQQFQSAQQQQQQDYEQDDQSQQQQYQQPAARQQQQQEPRPRSSHESTTFIPIIRFDKEQGNDGSYKAAWETGNNILAQEEGYLKSLGPDPDAEGETLNAQVQQGSYTYTSPEGQVITVNYIADEKGFHPTGDHLPTPPPVSPEVQKGLDLIYAGIRAQEEAAAREAQNPQQLRKEAPQQEYNNNQYRQ